MQGASRRTFRYKSRGDNELTDCREGLSRGLRFFEPRSPLRVINGPDGPETPLPVFPNQRTSLDRPGWSVWCRKTCTELFDDLIRAHQKVRRQPSSDCISSTAVDDQFELVGSSIGISPADVPLSNLTAKRASCR